ncbi:hypothetical protein J4E91_011142 [Alternaria rosae]|nr:hypothetical protein J4E91_011142 [Alternaria rosae]
MSHSRPNQASSMERSEAHQQLATIEQELQREREAHELLHQQFLELQECHCKLVKEHDSSVETLRKSARDSQIFADEVARQAEGLVQDLQAKLAGNEADQSQKSQSISGIILESAKNALLVEAVSSQHSQEEHFVKLKYVMDQNVGLQQRNEVLSRQNETLSQQVENGKSEVASLNKALELCSEDGRRKKPRRGKMSAGKG